MLPTDRQNRTIVATIDALIEALLFDDEELNTKVAAALRGFGPIIVPCLIRTAVTRRDCAGHCRRLLEVVEEIGSTGHPTGQLDLVPLVDHRDSAVRETVKRILDRPRSSRRQGSGYVQVSHACHTQVGAPPNQMTGHPQQDPLAQGTPTTPAFEHVPEFLENPFEERGEE